MGPCFHSANPRTHPRFFQKTAQHTVITVSGDIAPVTVLGKLLRVEELNFLDLPRANQETGFNPLCNFWAVAALVFAAALLREPTNSRYSSKSVVQFMP